MKKAYQRGVVAAIDEQAQERLVLEIASMAQGVFLWVSVALHDILRGLTKHDTSDELLRRVSRLPTDIERLYEDMLQRLGEDWQLYRQEAALYFKMCLLNSRMDEPREIWTSALVHFALSARKLIQNLPPLTRSDVNSHELLKQCYRTQLRILSCCAGMLEIENAYYETEADDAVFYGAVNQDESEVSLRSLLHISQRRVSFSHRTVIDFLLEKPAGQKVLACSPANDVAIFCSIIEAQLVQYMAGLHDRSIVYHVWELLLDVRDFYHYYMDEQGFSQQEMHKLLQGIEHTLPAIFKSSSKITDGKADQWVHNLAKDPDAHEMHYAVCSLDFMGLTLELGLPQYLEYEFDRMLQMKPHTGKFWSANYQNYLLFCASACETGRSVKVLDRLLEAGADPNATFYLPVRYPSKVSPWINFLHHLRFDLFDDPLGIIERFLSSGANLQELMVFELHGSYYQHRDLPNWRWRKFSGTEPKIRILVESNTVYLLREHLKSTNDQADLLQHPNIIGLQSYRQVILVGSSRGRQFAEVTSAEESESLLAMTNDLNRLQKSDEGEHVRKRLWAKVLEICDRSDGVDLLEFAERKGYYKHPDDRAVPQGPFERFEDLTEEPDEVMEG